MNHHTLTYPDTHSEQYYHARYHYLLQILFGETIAIDYCRTMASFAPTDEARAFLLRQQEEESRHLDMLTEYVGTHPRPHALISKPLKKLDALMVRALEERDYVACIFIQNFIVEGLNITLLRELEHHGDGVLSALCSDIVREEVEHMEFGVTEIKRILETDTSPVLKRKLVWLQRKALIYGTALAFTLGREAKYLGIPLREFVDKAVSEHFERIARANFPLPFIDTLLFKGMGIFLRILS